MLIAIARDERERHLVTRGRTNPRDLLVEGGMVVEGSRAEVVGSTTERGIKVEETRLVIEIEEIARGREIGGKKEDSDPAVWVGDVVRRRQLLKRIATGPVEGERTRRRNPRGRRWIDRQREWSVGITLLVFAIAGIRILWILEGTGKGAGEMAAGVTVVEGERTLVSSKVGLWLSHSSSRRLRGSYETDGLLETGGNG